MSEWSDKYEKATRLDSWTLVDDVGQAEVAAKGKALDTIQRRSLPGGGNVLTFTFADGMKLEVSSPDLMILEVSYAANAR